MEHDHENLPCTKAGRDTAHCTEQWVVRGGTACEGLDHGDNATFCTHRHRQFFLGTTTVPHDLSSEIILLGSMLVEVARDCELRWQWTGSSAGTDEPL